MRIRMMSLSLSLSLSLAAMLFGVVGPASASSISTPATFDGLVAVPSDFGGQFYLCNEHSENGNQPCVENTGVGNQVQMVTSGADMFTYSDDNLIDVTSGGYVLKLDPSLTGHPVVIWTLSLSAGATADEEAWVEGTVSGQAGYAFENSWAEENGQLLVDGYLHEDTLTYVVNGYILTTGSYWFSV